MNYHPDTQIPAKLLDTVGRWVIRVIRQISKAEMKDADAVELLHDLLGDAITLDKLRRLTGSAVLSELRERRVKFPRIAEGVFTGFAQAWSPQVPHCPSCALPAIRPLLDDSWVECLVEGTVCPWCGEATVLVPEAPGTIVSWVTGQPCPLDAEFDDTAVRGSRLPLQEEALQQRTQADLQALLDRHGVAVHAWLRYLLTSGYQELGLPRAPLPVLSSLSNDSVMQYGSHVVEAQVLAAKRALERPRAVDVHIHVHGGGAAPGAGVASGALTLDLVWNEVGSLSDVQFEQAVFRLRVNRSWLSASSAPLGTRVNDLMHLVRNGTVRLADVYDTARAVKFGC